MIKKHLYSLPLLAFSTIAFAHPGHALISLQAGFMHPFMGWDHLLMMIAIGLWASRQGGHSRWQLPTLFVSFMALGASLGFTGIGIAGVEVTIAIGLLLMSVLLFTHQSVPKIVAMAFVSVIATTHGLAHGLELIGQPYTAAVVGMLMATAVLHTIGYFAGSLHGQLARFVHAVFATGMLLTGGLLLVN
ncbi:MAG: HupE/UreJ family protein [Methylotenera sp.]|jgi:urease accessory protein